MDESLRPENSIGNFLWFTPAEHEFKDGIKAWVSMDEKKMKHLELFTELLSYATLDQSPFVMGSTRSNSRL
ncbi:hypothetical protein Ahy_A02g009914 [Arachis hypogaea]|uniref:Uncharacterized protein n=1 Tax=Arachis hypogaea TaxID=3818 RepID=A0A445EII6_ARAHY|nr:hypothetical protein Ahy_A02g009914 [Arachis hypogaea]